MNKTFLLVSAIGFMLCNLLQAQNYSVALEGVGCGESFREGLTTTRDWKIDKEGYIDASGRVVITPQFDDAGEFSCGMAVVKNGKLYGIINRQGYYLLDPIYQRISRNRDSPEVFTIVSSEGYGIFYNGRVVLEPKYSNCNVSFPFASFSPKDNDGNQYINLLSGERFYASSDIADIIMARTTGSKYKYFDLNGNELDYNKLCVNSRNLAAFPSDTSKYPSYGVKNIKTGEIIIPAEHFSVYSPVWINNKMFFNDIVVGETGNIIIEGGDYGSYGVYGSYIAAYDVIGGSDLFTETGEILIENAHTIHNLGQDNWFEIHKGQWQVFDAKTKKYYPGQAYQVKEGMIITHTDEYYYCINAETGVVVEGKYKFLRDYSEGLALATDFNDTRYFIDKSGKTIIKQTESLKFHWSIDGFSEGTIGCETADNKIIYIYNPLGHKGYTYNQEVFDDITVNNWWTKAGKYFDEGNYTKAKEYYYRIMINDPQNASAINNYGACMERMGYRDEAIKAYEMALQVDPSMTTAKDNLNRAKANRRAERQQRADGVMQALSNLGNLMFQVSNTLYGTGSGYGGYGSGSSGSSYSSSGGKSASYYQTQYDRWANRAKSNYNSLTNLGYSIKNTDGEHSGGTMSSMNSGNYVFQKKALREAQQEMRKIRQEAARNGVSIRKSEWEDATVKY